MKDETELEITYVPPKVITYSAEDLFEKIGPSKACSFVGGSITC